MMDKLFGMEVRVSEAIPKGVILIDNHHETHSHANCDCQIILLSRWERMKYKLRRLKRWLVSSAHKVMRKLAKSAPKSQKGEV